MNRYRVRCFFNIAYIFFSTILLFIFSTTLGQNKDTVLINQNWNFHFQNTVLFQYHPSFSSKYSGIHSMSNLEEYHTSISLTLYFGKRIWKGGALYFNPELSGGAGFSQTTGVAAFPNGEVYRVSDPSPHTYLARLFFRQIIPLTTTLKAVDDIPNQLSMNIPERYITVNVGKFSIMDFLDNNKYSDDPRTQFYNWVQMGVAAWDYPADTRGYTNGIILEMVLKDWEFRFATLMVPKQANGPVLDGNILRSRAEALEIGRNYDLLGKSGTIKLISFLNEARMGSYQKALEWGVLHNQTPAMDSVRAIGRTKYGFGINIAQDINANAGLFLRLGWNDGRNETWAFTEIDRSFSMGTQLNGCLWKRPEDKIGVAIIANGISPNHRKYLESGGYGFIIGDGRLNYATEAISEIYYSFHLFKTALWISPDYQFILNPGYNKDRGPIHAFGIRVHMEN
jgi:high affinity Mn2+ porin